MTRDEFDAAFKLALGYVISEKHFYSYRGGIFRVGKCFFKKNGINFIHDDNTEIFYQYDKIINFIPSINKYFSCSGVKKDVFYPLHNNIYISLKR